MTGFRVNAHVLGSFGWSVENDGASAAAIGPYCKQYAGQTEGLTGLLAEMSATISGYSADGIAYGLGTHYAKLATTLRATGVGLQNTARGYTKSDAKTLRMLDGKAPVVGSAADTPYDGAYQLSSTIPGLVPTHPSSDPTQSARDGMAIDVKGIDWLFNKATGHHITEPIDAFIGNWTTLSADAAAWGMVGEAWSTYSANMTEYAVQIDHIWDGNAARSFREYAARLADGMKGEAELCTGLQLVLNKLAASFEDTFNQVLSLITTVIHIVESAAIWLASLWWCGVGEAAAVEKSREALATFMRAWRVIDVLIKVVKYARTAMFAFHVLKNLLNDVVSIPANIAAKVDQLETAIRLVGAAPGLLDDIRRIPLAPTRGYGGPRDPGIT